MVCRAAAPQVCFAKAHLTSLEGTHTHLLICDAIRHEAGLRKRVALSNLHQNAQDPINALFSHRAVFFLLFSSSTNVDNLSMTGCTAGNNAELCGSNT